jgi:hypothetical protein
MQRPSKQAIPNRSSAGKRWSSEEDSLLVELVRQQIEWGDIAQTMKRAFISVQNRYRYLKVTKDSASNTVARASTRAQPLNSTPDLTCGAPSQSARRVLDLIIGQINQRAGQRPSYNKPLNGLDLITGALIRELLTTRHREIRGWLRITVSRINSPDHGVGRTYFSRLLGDLEANGLLERTVGYPGLVAFSESAARPGRFVFVRASLRLKKLCGQHGITPANLYTHFPSLAG